MIAWNKYVVRRNILRIITKSEDKYLFFELKDESSKSDDTKNGHVSLGDNSTPHTMMIRVIWITNLRLEQMRRSIRNTRND